MLLLAIGELMSCSPVNSSDQPKDHKIRSDSMGSLFDAVDLIIEKKTISIVLY